MNAVGQASVENELSGANKATKQTILRESTDRGMAKQKARQKDKRVRDEGGGGRKEEEERQQAQETAATTTTEAQQQHISGSIIFPTQS